MTTLPTDRFAPITLDGLLAEAELLTRFDRKYLLDPLQVSALLEEFDPGTRVLQIEGRRGFRYESVYFDTPDLLSYRQAAHVRRHRFKVRTRSYLDSGLAFLEVKVRGDREVTVKDRIDYDFVARQRLTNRGRDYVADTLAQRGIKDSVAGQLRPTLVTRYERLTLLPTEPGVRVTIDTGLAWQDVEPVVTAAGRRGDALHFLPNSAPSRHIRQPNLIAGNKWGHDAGSSEQHPEATDLHGRTLTLPELVIVETKSGSHPSGIDRLLWRNGHRPLSVSKYGTGLAALRGDLPANKWARVLRHHFDTNEEFLCAA